MKVPSKIEKQLNRLSILGSMLLLVNLSLDVFLHSSVMSSVAEYVQLVVCVVFMLDFFVRLLRSTNKPRFWMRNILLFLVSIPYLFLFSLLPIHVSKGTHFLLHLAPMIRGLYAVGLMILWLGKSRISTLFITYLGAMLWLVYFASVLFFEYEKGVNAYVSNYWEALWWACMDVTTVGSNIIAVSMVGKLLSVALAAMGMMMFPIFTTFVLRLYKKEDGQEIVNSN